MTDYSMASEFGPGGISSSNVYYGPDGLFARQMRRKQMDRVRAAAVDSLGREGVREFLYFHVNGEGQRMAIAEMTDAHLLNLLNLSFRKMEALRLQSDKALAAQSGMSEFHRNLYGVKRIDPAEAAEAVSAALLKLSPYIVEAALRGLDISAKLAAALGREPAAMTVNVGRLLTDGADPVGAIMDEEVEAEE